MYGLGAGDADNVDISRGELVLLLVRSVVTRRRCRRIPSLLGLYGGGLLPDRNNGAHSLFASTRSVTL